MNGVLWMGQSSGRGAAVWISSRQFETHEIGLILRTLEEHLGKLESSKLVGEERTLREIEAWLLSRGHRIANLAVRNGTFEVMFFPLEARIRIARKLRVLVVDDSKTIRSLLTKILSSDPGIEVVGAADRPSMAFQMVEQLKPDVMTLDLHMPEMSGLEVLKILLPKHPLPVVMVTAVSLEEGPEVLQCLEVGAVDYIQKPSAAEVGQIAPQLLEKLRMAASVKVRVQGQAKRPIRNGSQRIQLQREVIQDQWLVIGSSTGGTEALRQVLTALPEHIPPTLIVQHIPAMFSRAFAERMNELCPFRVKEAEDAEEVLPDHVYIAPGGKQMKIRKRGDGRAFIVVNDEAPMNRHKPSVDYLFHSVAEVHGGKCIGVILTGMGADGATGLKRLRDAGARTIAQDEKSCVVFGMPREAIRLGAAEQVLALEDVPEVLAQWFSQKKAA
jgi:two-component system chemotaxis response regulator CheB